jgi:hypothetical protein
LKIDSTYTRLTKFYSSIKKGVIDEIDFSNSSDKDYNFKLMQKEYKDLFVNKLRGKSQTSESNKVSQCLNKFKEFKNTLKSLYGLESQDLMCDNRIINFLESGDSSQPAESVQNFFLEASIDMYREIFKNK